MMAEGFWSSKGSASIASTHLSGICRKESLKVLQPNVFIILNNSLL